MGDRGSYVTGLLSAWLCFWGLILILIGVLITFNVSDTYYDSDFAADEASTDAIIIGLATAVLGVGIVVVGVGAWLIKTWAWWVATGLTALAVFSDIVNFARVANLLSALPDELGRKEAVWPIVMWRESLTFLGTSNNDVLLNSWPILLHLILAAIALLLLASPQMRESFGVTFGQMAPPIPSRPVGGDATRVPMPARPVREEPAHTIQHSVPPARLAYLIVQSGQGAGKSFQLQNQTTIGRSQKDNDIALSDNAVSREHAMIRLENQRFIFMDRGALNRSYLVTPDGKKEINKHTLMDGDEILIGETRLLYREGQPQT